MQSLLNPHEPTNDIATTLHASTAIPTSNYCNKTRLHPQAAHDRTTDKTTSFDLKRFFSLLKKREGTKQEQLQAQKWGALCVGVPLLVCGLVFGGFLLSDALLELKSWVLVLVQLDFMNIFQ